MEYTLNESDSTTGICFARANYSGSPHDIEIKNAQMLAGRKARGLARASTLAQSLTEPQNDEVNSDDDSDKDSVKLQAWGGRTSVAASDVAHENKAVVEAPAEEPAESTDEEPANDTELAVAADCPLEDDNGAFWIKIIAVFPAAIQPWMHVVVKMFVLYAKSRSS